MENLHTYETDFTTLHVRTDHVLVIMKEGITVVPAYQQYLQEVALKHFTNRPFGYITHRRNSYAVDPKVYIETSKIKNLVAFAIVSKTPLSLSNARIEQLFLSISVQVFDELDVAQAWVQEIVAQHT